MAPHPMSNAKAASGSVAEQERESPQGYLAWFIAIGGFATIIACGVVCICLDHTQAPQVMSAVLPITASWVGAVIAYYFGRENLSAATSSVSRLARNSSESAKPKPETAADVMVKRKEIVDLPGVVPDVLKSATLKEVQTFFKDKQLTRLPLFDNNGLPKYVIHTAELYEYLGGATLPVAPTDPLATTLETFLNTEQIKGRVAFGTVARDALLSEAKAAMDSIGPACLDVFVTEDGTPTTQVLGWLTDELIWEKLRAK